MKKSVICLIFALLFLFSGCHIQPAASPAPQLVKSITVIKADGDDIHEVHYTNSEKIAVILNYLRLIDPYGPPDTDPDKVAGREYRIELHYRKGPPRIYLQKADRYLMSDGKWRKIKQENAEFLGLIVEGMESDRME